MLKTETDCSNGAINFTMTDLSQTRDSILMLKLPMPPTSNSQYKLFRRGNKTYHVPSDGLKAFQSEMAIYGYSCANLQGFKTQIQNWRHKGLLLEIRALFFFHRSKLFTQKGEPKKMDVSNRLKALHDSVSSLLEIDDSLFFRVYAEKAEAHLNLEEMVCVEICPIV